MELHHPAAPRSAILYQEPSQNIYILDIPRSIELAQQLQRVQWDPEAQNHRKQTAARLLSCAPLQTPYPGPSPEPKTDAARRKVLERTPFSELEAHASIGPVVSAAHESVRREYAGPWCLERRVLHSHLSEDDYRKGVSGDPAFGSASASGCSRSRRRKRGREREQLRSDGEQETSSIISALSEPPVILSPGINWFPGFSSIRDSIVNNPGSSPAVLQFPASTITVPPESTFLSSHLTFPSSHSLLHPTSHPAIPIPKFNLLVFDPPWPNRSVWRSSHYATTHSFADLRLFLENIISTHLISRPPMGGSNLAIVGIWITNSAQSREAVRSASAATHLELFEEWIWVKCTTAGEPVMPVDGLWRKPYEVIQWGRRRSAEDEGQVRRRVIFAVPDIHSRKPSLKELTETIFFPPERSERIPAYSALEVFARHLTTEWWACGDEVLKFNDAEWWADMGS